MAGNPNNHEDFLLIKFSLFSCPARNLYILSLRSLEWWGRSLATAYRHDKPLERYDDGLQNTIDGFADHALG